MTWEVLAVGRGGRRWLARESGDAAIGDWSTQTLTYLSETAEAALGRGYWEAPTDETLAGFFRVLPGLRHVGLGSVARTASGRETFEYNPDQARHPAGSPEGGRFVKEGEGGGGGEPPEGWAKAGSDPVRDDIEAAIAVSPTAGTGEADPLLVRLTEETSHIETWEAAALTPDGHGHVRLNFDDRANLSGEQKQAVAATIDELRRDNPVQDLVVEVVPTLGSFGGAATMAGLRPGSSYMVVSADAAMNPNYLDRAVALQGPEFLTEGARSMGPSEFLLTHEYGHALQNQRDGATSANFLDVERAKVRNAIINDGATSGYGSSSQEEAYAEAYVTWRATDGETGLQLPRDLAKIDDWEA